MNHEDCKKLIKLCYKANIPLCLWSAPGAGKTSIFNQVFEELKINHDSLNGSIVKEIQLTGIPDRNGNFTEFLRPKTLPPEQGEFAWLLDEIPLAKKEIKNSLFQLVLERRILTHKLSPETWVMAAGNRMEDKAGATPLPSPLITRFTHAGLWCEAPNFDNYTVPSNQVQIDPETAYKHYITIMHPYVVGFLKNNPDSIYDGQAVPRTWEMASKLVENTHDWFEHYFMQGIIGTVGRKHGMMFNNFLKIALNCPSIDKIISDPINTDLPNRNDVLHALIAALARRSTNSNAASIMKYVNRIPQREYQFFYYTIVQSVNPEVISEPEFIRWTNDNKSVLY